MIQIEEPPSPASPPAPASSSPENVISRFQTHQTKREPEIALVITIQFQFQFIPTKWSMCKLRSRLQQVTTETGIPRDWKWERWEVPRFGSQARRFFCTPGTYSVVTTSSVGISGLQSGTGRPTYRIETIICSDLRRCSWTLFPFDLSFFPGSAGRRQHGWILFAYEWSRRHPTGCYGMVRWWGGVQNALGPGQFESSKSRMRRIAELTAVRSGPIIT